MAWLQKIAALSQGGSVDITKLFSVDLWTGNSTSQDIVNSLDLTGEGGMVWIKSRTSRNEHFLFDTLRGAGESIQSQSTLSEITISNSLTQFNDDGYSLGDFVGVNSTGNNFVGWSFRKSPKFFDIVTYVGDAVAGREVPHNLGVQPGLVLIKDLGQSNSWSVQSINIPATEYLALNLTNASKTDNDIWNSTHADENNLTLGTSFLANQAGSDFIAYLFAHDPDGVIQCGEYTGTGLTGNPQILGWEPQFILIKSSSGSHYWVMIDTTRGIGTTDARLFPNTADSESNSVDRVTLQSDGFSLVGNHGSVNSNGLTYIYMAIRKPE